MIWDYADLIAVVYTLAALATLIELVRHWGEFSDDDFTSRDHSLAARVGLLILIPLGVLGHELGHMLTASLLGGQDVALHFRVYWGFVTFKGPIGPDGQFLIAAAGPLVSLILGSAALLMAFVLRQPYRTALQQFGIWTLALILVFYPVLSFTGPIGDFRIIYSSATPVWSFLAGAVHLAAAVGWGVVLIRQGVRPRSVA